MRGPYNPSSNEAILGFLHCKCQRSHHVSEAGTDIVTHGVPNYYCPALRFGSTLHYACRRIIGWQETRCRVARVWGASSGSMCFHIRLLAQVLRASSYGSGDHSLYFKHCHVLVAQPRLLLVNLHTVGGTLYCFVALALNVPGYGLQHVIKWWSEHSIFVTSFCSRCRMIVVVARGLKRWCLVGVSHMLL